MNRPAKVRGRYRKDDDEAMAVLIRRLVDERPSYGYRRITALVTAGDGPTASPGSTPSECCGSCRSTV
jgi:hypothetical protein